MRWTVVRLDYKYARSYSSFILSSGRQFNLETSRNKLDKMKSAAVLASLTAVASAQLFPDCVNGPLANNSVCDVTKSMLCSPSCSLLVFFKILATRTDGFVAPWQRATALVAAMTLAEKINISGTSGGPVAVPRLGLPDYWWWNEVCPHHATAHDHY